MKKELSFDEKYTNEAEKEEIENKSKIILSNDAFAIGKSINDLADAIKRNS